MTMAPSCKRFLRTFAAATALGLAFVAPVPAQTPAKVADAAAKPARPADATAGPEAAAVKKLLEQKFPGATVSNVSKSGYFGLYEAQFDGQIVYTDAKVAYVMVGAVYDTTTKQNLTEDRLRKLNRVAWDSLPFELAMKKVKGTGARKLAIFSDADCPFCARLESELKGVEDVTIYTFLYPIDQLHPDSARKSKMIWCSADRLKAWDDFFAAGKLPDNKGECDNPLAATHDLGQKLRVTATPTLVFADGTIIPGALPRDRLEAEFVNAAADAKTTATAPKK
jgi:thiol:disulfide interchange protein DsbC